MSQPENPLPKSPTSHLHVMNLVVALLAGVISITGGIYSLKNNLFSGPVYGSLQGTVLDERIARPLKLAFVEISDLAGAVVNTATTDDGGHYLIEALKTGSYVVKFTAPLHKIETKTIKIEKDRVSLINVELFPEAQQTNPSPGEYGASVQKNIPAPYASATTYPAAIPEVPGYNVPKNNPSVPTGSPDYSQPAPDPTSSGSSRTGFRRHPHRSYSGDPTVTSSGTPQSTSQGSALAMTGAQLLQALLSKKTENSTSTTSN